MSDDKIKIDVPVFEFDENDISYRDHIISELMPKRELHICSGPSGSGKSSLLMRWMDAFSRGESFFGHKTYPEPFAYISADRSAADMRRTLERLKLDPKRFPLFVPKVTQNMTAIRVLDEVKKKYPKVGVFVFEGLATYVPDGKLQDYKIVAMFLREIEEWCARNNCTVIGVCHSPKCKEKDGYKNPRERVMGSTAWAAYSNCIIFVEPVEPENGVQCSARKLYLLPRNAPEEIYTMDWKEGLLVQVSGLKMSNAQRVQAYVADQKKNESGLILFTTAALREATMIPEASITLELKKLKEAGIIESVKTGTYKVIRPLAN